MSLNKTDIEWYQSLFRYYILKLRCRECIHAYDGQCYTDLDNVACEMHFERKKNEN